MIAIGIGSLIARWYRGKNNNSNLRKYSQQITYLGFANMILISLAFKTYDYTTNNIGIKLTNKIETYKTEYGNYPNEIKTLSEKLNLNLIEKYITDKIVYKKTENKYILELKFLNHNLKEFDNELKEWN